MTHISRNAAAATLCLAAALLGGHPAVAQDTLAATAAAPSDRVSLDVDEAVKIALANNAGLKEAAVALETKRRAAGVAWNATLPSITASAGLSRTGTSTTAADTGTLAATGSGSLSLSLSAALPQALDLVRLAYESQLVSFRKAEQQLALSVRKAYYQLLLDHENLALARQNIARQEESYTQTEKKYKAGLASELDLLTAKVNLETLRPKALGYETTLANDLDSFRASLGLGAVELELSGSLDVQDASIAGLVDEAMKQPESANLSVAAAAKVLSVDRVTKQKLVNAAYLPSLALSASVAPSFPLSSSSATAANSVTTTLSAMASISVDNFLPWSSTAESIASADDTLKIDTTAYEEAIRTTKVSRQSYRRSVEGYRSTLAVLRLNVELTQRTYNAAKIAYDKGLETLTDLQTAAGNLESARLSMLSESYNLIAALLDLSSETGLALDTTGRLL